MRQMFICEEVHTARLTVDGYLRKGWRVVPGTTVLSSMQEIASASDPIGTTREGFCFRKMLAITLEFEQEQPSHAPTRSTNDYNGNLCVPGR